MTDTSRYIVMMRTLALAGAAVASLLASLLLMRLAGSASPDREITPAEGVANAGRFAPPHVSIGLNWNVFRARPAARSATGIEGRFRLAGTFFAGTTNGRTIGRAVLDWIERNRQEIVSEGDRLDNVLVVRVAEDHVVLRAGAQDEILWLSFSGRDAAAETPHAGAKPDVTDIPGAPPGGRFGHAIGDNNWLFRREALMAYYNELMNDPVRLLHVFDSMKPLYDADENITGYMLDIVGERQFFEAVGFQEGDVVRRVNAVPMTNRQRAERFIEHFARNNINVFVLDIERAGEPTRLVYRIRE